MMGQLPAAAEALATDRVALAFFGAPYWIWLLVGFCLGALTLWTYWRCYIDEARRDPSLIGFWPQLPAPRGRYDAAATPPPGAALREAADGAFEPPAPPPAPVESGRDETALRYRNWALETRLRQALDAAAEDAPLDVAALSQGLEDVLLSGVAPGEDGAPPEEISLLKHRIWVLEGRLAAEEAGLAPPPQAFDAHDGAAAQAAPGAAADDALRARLAERLLVASRLGDWRLVGRVERELAEGIDPEPDAGSDAAALLTRLSELEAERDHLTDVASGLRYRRWLLSRRLGDAVEAAQRGDDLAAEALIADLNRDGESPRYGALGENAFLLARPAALAPLPPADRSADVDALSRRAATLEAALRRERAGAEAGARASAAAEAASLRYRLWLAQAELRRAAPVTVATAPPPDAAALAAAQAEAARLRQALVESEASLHAARGDADGERAALRQRAAGLDSDRAAAEARAEAAESRLAELEAAADAARQEAEGAKAAIAAAHTQGDGHAEELRSALWRAERAELAAEERRIDAERMAALEAEAAELRRGARLAPQLSMEIEALRAELRRLKAAPLAAAPLVSTPLVSTPPPAASLVAAPPVPAAAPVERSAAQSGLVYWPSTDPQTKEAIRAALAPSVESPRRGVEAAALELIESGRVVALDSNRPANLRDVAQPGEPDDLSVLRGASSDLRAAMRRAGLFSFRQFAELGAYDLAWLDDLLSLNGAVVRQRWAPQAEQLSAWRRDGRLRYGPSGETLWRGDAARRAEEADAGAGIGLLEPALLRAIADEAARPEPAHPASEPLSTPLTGAEAAALDLLQLPETPAEAARLPASFSREPFAPGDALDDLQAIIGVGPSAERALRILGVGRYRQIAALSPEEAAWLDRRLGLRGRVLRDRWLPQAQRLAARAASLRSASASAAPTRQWSETAWSEIDWAAPAGPAAAWPPQDAAERLDAAQQSSLTGAEREALRLIDAGAVATVFGLAENRPASLLRRPVGPSPDKLEAIRGVTASLAQQMNGLGVFHFSQIAAFSASDLAWLDAKLSLSGRVVRDRWAAQAAALEALDQGGP